MLKAVIAVAAGALAGHLFTESEFGRRHLGGYIASRAGPTPASAQAAGLLASSANKSGLSNKL